jgi:CRISPR-associated protein Csb2
VWNKHETLTLALLGMGDAAAFAGPDTDSGQSRVLMSSDVWVSRTPFVPTRHPKSWRDGRPKVDAIGLQIGSPEHDVRRLLRENGYPEPRGVASVPEVWLGGKPTRWAAYRTRRHGGGGRRSEGSHGFKVTFGERVAGPICVGYGAHLGLGMFVPADAAGC